MTLSTIPVSDASKWDLRFLELAKLVASWSKDPSTKTGAVIVRPNQSIASLGFNGFPSKMDDQENLYLNRDEKYSRIIHCEMNALLYAEEKVHGYTLYTFPFISCDRCYQHMVQAGITRFVAPAATEEQLTRWGSAFDRVRSYAMEMDLDLTEIQY
jgi:dCMP deaminase